VNRNPEEESVSQQTASPSGPAAQPAADLDPRFESAVQDRFDRLMDREPVWATFLGIHKDDERLGDASRQGREAAIAETRGFIERLEKLDGDLDPATAFERELALHAARRTLFDDEVHRVWDQRANAMDEIGDGLFGLLARDFAPLEERLQSMTGRLEDAPRVLEENRARVGDRPVRLWNEIELESAKEIDSLFAEIAAAGRTVWGADSPEQKRLDRARQTALAAVEEYKTWLGEVIGRGHDEIALGSERYDELVRLRAFDGLSTDEILEIGEEQLASNEEGRRGIAKQIDADATEAEVLDRVKSRHPASFEEALEGYREAMFRARDHIVQRGLATIPPGESLAVMPTPDYLRNVMPFAAYFEPPKFDARPSGIYIVTPSVDDDPGAMREHNYSSISNTSIHEAYPGHHLQLSAAVTHPSLTRIMVDAPEFVEGWGMYSEQMMREEGFDAGPEFLLMMYTDAIWRACRIILDVKLHRGEVSVPEAIDFLVSHTGFERPNATAEVRRYTYTPTYQLSYLLGKVLLLRLRDAEKQRLGSDFSLGRFHDSLLYAGSLPISFHRRLLESARDGAAA
jgi:uncharacterized protein (DUF885 family)